MNRYSLLLAALLPCATTLTPRVLAEGTTTQPSPIGVKPILAGDKKVALNARAFGIGKVRNSALIRDLFTSVFASSILHILTVAGEFSESKAPRNLTNIDLSGYSPKAMSAYGTVLLCKAKVDNGNRILGTKGMLIEKDFWTPLLDSAKLVQTKAGAWAYQIVKPLERGHYLIAFAKNPQYYWDFDVY